jgi:hypothetical protein
MTINRRIVKLIAPALLAATLLVATSGPAAADQGAAVTGGPTAADGAGTLLGEGDVYNNLVTYTVHIATFGGGNTNCTIWNQYATFDVSYVTWSCNRYWLPYGRSDDDIRGAGFDTDGFMVEQDYAVNMGGGTFRHIPGGTWTRIHGNAAANCSYRSDLGKPMCHVFVK